MNWQLVFAVAMAIGICLGVGSLAVGFFTMTEEPDEEEDPASAACNQSEGSA
jgi:hypothetical protein